MRFVSILLAGLLQTASGQTLESARSSIDSSGALVYEGSFVFQPPRPTAAPVTGAPFSAEEVAENQQIRPDGSRLEQSQSRGQVYRDSQGRVRWERPLRTSPDMPAPLVIEIADAVAGYHFTMDLRNRIAHRSILPPPGTEPVPGRARPVHRTRVATADSSGSVSTPGDFEEAASPQEATATLPPAEGVTTGPRVDQLGTRLIDGIPADGTRFTNVLPGKKPEDRPNITTSETWMSTELRMVILSKFTDPLNGDRAIRLKNVRRSEPDPGLFQIPPGYTIQDEAGEFHIDFVFRK